jgi:myo-inositol-hexaphosphate 3-phosphohydrolase
MAVATWLLVAAAPSHGVVNVCPSVETAPVHSIGDAADDAAVWLHPTDPSLSTLIGTDKSTTGGLNVYGLSGAELQFKPDGRLNNDDVRYNFPLGSTRIALVGASNRVAKTLDFYKVNEGDRTLTKVGTVPVSSAIVTPRGFALYHSPVSGKYYAFVTDSGHTEQYELNGSSGQVTGTRVRTLTAISNATEGLVADDELGRVYVAEEDIGGIWRFAAEPTEPTSGARILTTTENGGPVVQDVKGITIYYASGGRGYLLAASQGSDTFHVLQRRSNAYVGEFKIVTCGSVDGVTDEDGIDVTNFNLGPRFPNGFFTSQDHINDGATNQNHKLVPWESIANAFSPPLVIDNSWDPRRIGAPAAGYPRPAAAAKLHVKLAVAYARCVAGDRSHGGGLAASSCRAPARRSSHLTVGTLDANGLASNSIGFVKMRVVGESPIDPTNGDQADVALDARVTGVRWADLTAYAGELGATVRLRITDGNSPKPPESAAATVQDVRFSFVIPCAAASDPSAGATCAVATTADTLAPGTVVEAKRAIWRLGPVAVTDGGPDGVVATADNKTFLSQGIFVP